MIFLLANWKWLLGAAAAVALGLMLGFSRIEIANLKASAAQTALDIQKQKTDAANILAAAEKHAREVEQHYADLNIQVEKDHADAAATIDAAHTANRALLARIGGLYDKAGRGAGSGGNLPISPDAAGGGSGVTTGGGCQLSGAVSENLLDAARDADIVAAYARSCHSWAMSLH